MVISTVCEGVVRGVIINSIGVERPRVAHRHSLVRSVVVVGVTVMIVVVVVVVVTTGRPVDVRVNTFNSIA